VTTTTSTTSAATSAKHKGKARRPEALLVLDIGHAGVSALPIVRDHAMLCHLQFWVPPPPQSLSFSSRSRLTRVPPSHA
jgi:hypothetical protein